MKPFNLDLSFDGQFLHIDYCDGSDVEHRICPDRAKLMAEVNEAVDTALSPEEE